ncbi:MAG: RHS repeat-associated core domain-containing protein [Acidobacteria bacterium]|nr:RHS repeat-associated core domain-containing protein [Acidobacteriota bacterium]
MEYALNAETATDEAGHWKTLERDALGRVVKVTEPDGTGKTNLDTTYEYLPSGELTDVHQGVQHRNFTYDGVGNLTSAILPELEFTKEWEYDADGLVTQEFTRGVTAWVAFSYDGIGRPLTKSVFKNSQQTDWYQYLYDGNVQTGWDLPISTFTGHQGRLTAKRGSSNGTTWQECYAYDAPTGRVLDKYLHLNASSSLLFAPYDTVTHYAYNLSGGLTDITYPPELSGHSAKAVRLALDTENRPTGAETESNSLLAGSITYAVHGPLQCLTTPQVQSNPSDPLQYSRAYHPATLRLSSIRLDRLSTPPPGSPLMDFTYQYDPDGNVQQIYHGGFGGVNVEAFVYDALDRLGSVSYGGLGNIEYSYDRYGNLLSRSVFMNAAHTTDASFEFDASALAPRNRLPGGGDIPAEYDVAGNQTLVTWKEGTTTIADELTYDAANRLTSCVRWELPEGQVNFTTVSEGNYVYDDGKGRLYAESVLRGEDELGYPRYDTKETVYVTDPAGETLSEITCERYTGEYRSADLQSTGASAIEGDDASTLDSCNPVPSGEKIFYQFTDHLGSTRYSAGARWKFYHPDDPGNIFLYCYQEELFEAAENLTPYGGFLTPNPPPSPLDFLAFDPITFTGKPRDVESGLDYSKARYYSNNLGRWPSPDPNIMMRENLGNPQNWNLYVYCKSNPLRFIDPNGNNGLDWLQTALDAAGCVPIIGEAADGLNAAISLCRGDYVGAACSLVSMIPVGGDAIGKGGKIAIYGEKAIVKTTEKAVIRSGEKVFAKVFLRGISNAVGAMQWLPP